MNRTAPSQADTTIRAIEEKIRAAQADMIQADAALALAVVAYDASLDEGRDAAVAARRVRDDAEIDCDCARRRVEKLESSLVEAQEAAEAARVGSLLTKAGDAARAFEAAARRDLPKMISGARTLLRLWAEAEIARDQACRACGDDCALPDVEAFRSIPGRPRQEIEKKRVLRWIHPIIGDAMDDATNARVTGRPGSEYLPHAGGGQPWRLEKQIEVDRIVYLEAEWGPRFVSLIEDLRIPGLMAGDQPGWSGPVLGTNPLNVLAQIEALETAAPFDRTDQRERKVLLRTVAAGTPATPSAAAE